MRDMDLKADNIYTVGAGSLQKYCSDPKKGVLHSMESHIA